MESQRAMANTLHFPFHLKPIPSHRVTPSLMLLFTYQSLPSDYEIFEKYYGGTPKMLIAFPTRISKMFPLSPTQIYDLSFQQLQQLHWKYSFHMHYVLLYIFLSCVYTLFRYQIVNLLSAKTRIYSLLVFKMRTILPILEGCHEIIQVKIHKHSNWHGENDDQLPSPPHFYYFVFFTVPITVSYTQQVLNKCMLMHCESCKFKEKLMQARLKGKEGLGIAA